MFNNIPNANISRIIFFLRCTLTLVKTSAVFLSIFFTYTKYFIIMSHSQRMSENFQVVSAEF